jgi:hypothetical protein
MSSVNTNSLSANCIKEKKPDDGMQSSSRTTPTSTELKNQSQAVVTATPQPTFCEKVDSLMRKDGSTEYL